MPSISTARLAYENERMKSALRAIIAHCMAVASGDVRVVADGCGDYGGLRTHEVRDYLGSILSHACCGLDDYDPIANYVQLVHGCGLDGEAE